MSGVGFDQLSPAEFAALVVAEVIGRFGEEAGEAIREVFARHTVSPEPAAIAAAGDAPLIAQVGSRE